MHQYWYMNLKGSGQLYNNKISVPPLYSQPHIPKRARINRLGIPEGWSDQVYSTGWKCTEGFKGLDRIEQSVKWTSPYEQMGLTELESSSGWTTPADHEGFTHHGLNGDTMPAVVHDHWESHEQPANWPKLPEPQGFTAQGQPSPLAQPVNQAGGFVQGQPPDWATSADHTGFTPQKQPTPWVQPIHHAGMFAQGHPAALLPPFANPFGYSASGQQGNWGGFAPPLGWGGQVNPMGWGGLGAPIGWGNNVGNGQPGILGGLLKVGKGTMNGIGVISTLIGVGKFLF